VTVGVSVRGTPASHRPGLRRPTHPAWSQGINATVALIGFDPIREVLDAWAETDC